MGILYRLVFLSACPGTHHKLALDALRHLRCPDADGWRELFLNYYEPYLRGAKVPDDEFKDFQNHVFHVRDNGWGGAIRTSKLWYERLVLALRRQYWSDAVYSAGILSHYFTDPLMPFHTGQSEEEGKVHRAAEWSISKSYEELQNILEQDLGGYPSVTVSDGPDWLERLMRQGAELANSHYDALLDHYHLAKGVEDPPAGLDQECKDRIAQMIGYAAVGFARVLERAFVEAGSCPPMCELVVETFLATVKLPARWFLQRLADEDERDQLEAILEEAERRGKVVENLPDDERFVRKLHAHQVLKVPLSELDAQPARPTGLKHGYGTPPRHRRPGFLARWFDWDIRPLAWLADEDRPLFVPPAPVSKQGVGMGTTMVRATTPRAARTPLAATVRRRRRPGERYRGRTTAGSRFDRESPATLANTSWDEAAASAEEMSVAVPETPRPTRVPQERQPVESAESTEQPTKRRGWGFWRKAPTAVEAGDEERRKVDPPENERAEDERPEGDSEDGAAESDSGDETDRPSRRARVGQALRGMASRVWQGATQTAGKVKRLVPRLRRRSPKDSAAEPSGEEASALLDRQEKPADGERDAKPSARSGQLKFNLQWQDEVEAAPTIGPKMARRLEAVGIRTVGDLLEADANQLAGRLGHKSVDADAIRQWQQQSELMTRVPELRGHDAQILVACGVTDPAELAAMDPASLFELIEPFLGTREAEAFLRGSPPPDLNEVADWIDWAQHARPPQAA